MDALPAPPIVSGHEVTVLQAIAVGAGFPADVDAGTIGLVLTGGMAAGVTLHGIASMARAQIRPRAKSSRCPTEIAKPSGLIEREGPPENHDIGRITPRFGEIGCFAVAVNSRISCAESYFA